MKKMTAVILMLVFAVGFLTACGKKAPETVVYDGTVYKTGFYGDFSFLNDVPSMTEKEVEIDGVAYQLLNIEGHDWICTKESEPTVYCALAQWEEEKAFYENAENFLYTVSFGNALKPVDMINVTGMDDASFESLRKFADKHSFNPKHPKADKGQLKCPRPESEESEIHFYRSSSDGLFSEGKENTYFLINNQVVMLYSYDSEDVCSVVIVPDELTELIGNLVNVLSAM